MQRSLYFGNVPKVTYGMLRPQTSLAKNHGAHTAQVKEADI